MEDIATQFEKKCDSWEFDREDGQHLDDTSYLTGDREKSQGVQNTKSKEMGKFLCKVWPLLMQQKSGD